MRALMMTVLGVFALWASPVRASQDVTGIWWVVDHSAHIVMERQADRLRVGVTGAKDLGLDYSWYVGSAGVSDPSFQTVKVIAVKAGTKSVALDSRQLQISLTDNFRGTLTVSGRTFDIEHREFNTGGLVAALDAQAPESGWYRAADGAEVSFIEAQGSKLYVARFVYVRGKLSVKYVVGSKKKDFRWDDKKTVVVSRRTTQGVVGFTLAEAGKPMRKFERMQFAQRAGKINPDETRSLEGLDADFNGVRDDIDRAIFNGTIPSSRVREALTELARAYRSHLVAPSSSAAVEALERVGRAKVCLNVLAPSVSPDPSVLIEALTFNTVPRLKAEIELHLLAGPREVPEPTISLANPNDCARFMQGVARRYDNVSLQTLRQARSTRAASPDERAAAAKALATGAEASGDEAQTCNNTKITVVTGVKTNGDGAETSRKVLETKMRLAGIDRGGFDYSSIADSNPGYTNDILQYIYGNLKFSPIQAGMLVRTAFRLILSPKGALLALTKTRRGLEAPGFLLANVALDKILRKYVDEIVKESDVDEANLANVLTADVANFRRVIAVAHSRGNQRINGAYDRIGDDVRKSVAIAAVANPQSSIATGGLPATRDDDMIINLARKVFNPQRATITDAGKPKEFLGHELVDSYLANPTARTVVLSRIKDALKKAEIPPGADGRKLDQASGGYTGPAGQKNSFKIGRNGVTFKLTYDAYSIPDQFDVIHRGRTVASTNGQVSGYGTLDVYLPPVQKDPNDGDVIVVVYGTDRNTGWEYQVTCPSAQ